MASKDIQFTLQFVITDASKKITAIRILRNQAKRFALTGPTNEYGGEASVQTVAN